MPFDERTPTPTNPWTLNNLPIVIGWIDDDRPAVLSGPQSTSDPWTTEGQGWGTVHVVATQVADNIDRRGGREATLRRLAATARAHGWPWIPAATARPDGARCALAIAVHGIRRATAVELARGAGQGVVLELGPERLRVLDLVGGQVTTVRRHHLPDEMKPPWLSGRSELLRVWRERHRLALDPIGAGSAPAAGSAEPRVRVADETARSCSDHL
jgi:hypothetical protein